MIMMEELYDALKDGGTSDEKARAAAREVAGYDNRLTNIEGELKLIRSELSLHRWVLGYLAATSTAMLVMLARLLMG